MSKRKCLPPSALAPAEWEAKACALLATADMTHKLSCTVSPKYFFSIFNGQPGIMYTLGL